MSTRALRIAAGGGAVAGGRRAADARRQASGSGGGRGAGGDCDGGRGPRCGGGFGGRPEGGGGGGRGDRRGASSSRWSPASIGRCSSPMPATAAGGSSSSSRAGRSASCATAGSCRSRFSTSPRGSTRAPASADSWVSPSRRTSRPRGASSSRTRRRPGRARWCASRAIWRRRSDAPDARRPTRTGPIRRSESVVLDMADPAGNHNGGMIAFGPDGRLWAGTGDGGSGGDPWDNARNPASLLGKMLRIDVGAATRRPAGAARGPRSGLSGCAIPGASASTARPARSGSATSARTPGRRSTSRTRNGPAPLHFGWRTMEGFHCYDPRQGCDAKGLELPVYEYGHDAGCSVTGGYVYRGQAIPALAGTYLFSDYCTGTVWSLARDAERQGRASSTLLQSQRPGELVRRGRGRRALPLRPRRRQNSAPGGKGSVKEGHLTAESGELYPTTTAPAGCCSRRQRLGKGKGSAEERTSTAERGGAADRRNARATLATSAPGAAGYVDYRAMALDTRVPRGVRHRSGRLRWQSAGFPSFPLPVLFSFSSSVCSFRFEPSTGRSTSPPTRTI